MAPRAFIYTRISDDRADGDGVARQASACHAHAARLGLDVVHVFTDNSISAWKAGTRPQYEAMLARLPELGTDGAVLVFNLDRLTRDLSELASVVERFQSIGVLLESVNGGRVDFRNSDDLLKGGLVGLIANVESARKSERSKASTLQRIGRGEWTGGTRPFGWQRAISGRWELHPSEAQMVRDAYAHVLKDGSLGSFVSRMNAADVTTSRGGRWDTTKLRQLLKRPRNAGLVDLHGELLRDDRGELLASEMPPIESVEMWRAVCAVFGAPERRRRHDTQTRWLLSGIAQCQCGAPVYVNTRKKLSGEVVPYYSCRERRPGSAHVARDVAYADAFVLERVVMMWRAVKRAAPVDATVFEDRRIRLDARRADIEHRMDSVADLLADDPTGNRELVHRANVKLKAEAAALQVEAESLERERQTPVIEPEYSEVDWDSPEMQEWAALDLHGRRDFIRTQCNVVLFSHSNKGRRQYEPQSIGVLFRARGVRPGMLDAAGIEWLRRQQGEPTKPGSGITLEWPDGSSLDVTMDEWRAVAQGADAG